MEIIFKNRKQITTDSGDIINNVGFIKDGAYIVFNKNVLPIEVHNLNIRDTTVVIPGDLLHHETYVLLFCLWFG